MSALKEGAVGHGTRRTCSDERGADGWIVVLDKRKHAPACRRSARHGISWGIGAAGRVDGDEIMRSCGRPGERGGVGCASALALRCRAGDAGARLCCSGRCLCLDGERLPTSSPAPTATPAPSARCAGDGPSESCAQVGRSAAAFSAARAHSGAKWAGSITRRCAPSGARACVASSAVSRQRAIRSWWTRAVTGAPTCSSGTE